MTVYMIFDVKLYAGFTHKASLVTDGHKLYTPTSMIYTYFVSRDRVRIVLLIAAINGLYFQCSDMHNADLNANPKDRV